MSSRNIFGALHENMCYFHRSHGQSLLSMQQQCKRAKTVADLHHLASDIHSFCHYLHNHHTIEDQRIFPKLARKIDISHLEDHHKQLSQLLIEFKNFSHRLKQLKKTDDEDLNSIINEATLLVDKVSKLVNEHERAEEQVLEADNLKKWFTESEIKQLFNL
ncbi:hypothetical protein I4U23_003700 [Adineta vaga]|nr:hypothetical protein I4U23_003700 [Adineta vaga]